MKKQAAAAKPVGRRKQTYPPGWNEKKVRDVIPHYDNQTEDEELAEYEAAFEAEGQTVMIVPTDLVPAIRQLIARRQGA